MLVNRKIHHSQGWLLPALPWLFVQTYKAVFSLFCVPSPCGPIILLLFMARKFFVPFGCCWVPINHRSMH